jgi:alpha-galactosidase
MTTKITELTEPQRGWRFHSGATIYTERLRDGRLIAASFQAAGVPCFPTEEESATPAFDLQIDGDSLAFGWELIESAVTATDAETPSAQVLLRHTLKPVELEIVTLAGGDGFFRRRMRLRNTSEKATLGLTSVTPLAGALWVMTDNLRENLHDSGGVPYRVGWMQENEWGYEGNFQWHDVPLNTELAFGSRRGKSGYGTPFAVAQNNVYGDFLVVSLAWSANWRMSFHCDYSRLTGSGKLLFAIQPTGPAPMRLLAPGETVTLPEVHFGMNHVSMDDAIQGWHAYLRKHVVYRVGKGVQPVIYNTWGYAEHELSEASLKSEIDIAAEIGAELFTVDSGWYADVNTPWYETSGDWQCGNRLPNDLFPVFEYARSKGLKCGLWAEIESAGKLSNLAKEHPDWFIERYGKRIERILDLTKPAVRDYVEGHIVRLIERYHLDLFRLDYNLDAGEGGFNLKEGHQENTLWRHVETIQEIFDRVRNRYPNLLLQNCSGGGGRNDLGMLSRFNTTQASDWMKMPRAVRILNGMSLALPPEIIDRWLGVAVHHKIAGNLNMQLHSMILCHPVVSDFAPNLAEANPEALRVTKKYLAIYRDFIRPFHREARLYHHTPVIPGADASGWCALELVAPDRRRAVAGVFRLVNADRDDYCLRLRGLDPGRRYRVTIEPGGMERVLDGHMLSEQGLTVRLDTPLTSRLLLCEATD